MVQCDIRVKKGGDALSNKNFYSAVVPVFKVTILIIIPRSLFSIEIQRKKSFFKKFPPFHKGVEVSATVNIIIFKRIGSA